MKNTLHAFHRKADLCGICQISLAGLDIHTLQERPITRSAHERTNFVARLTQQTRQMASGKTVGSRHENSHNVDIIGAEQVDLANISC